MDFEYSHFRSKTELRIGVLMWQIISPCLFLFGTTCNILSIVVLSGRNFNGQASAMYLRGLAAADLAVLHVGLLLDWIKFVFDIDTKLIHPFFCKTSLWLIYACADISVWLLIAVTFERVMHTLYPMKSKSVCTKLFAKCVVLFISTGALAINSHLLFGFGTLEIETMVDNITVTMEIPCAPLTEEYAYFFSKVWIWIGMCKFSLIPFAVLTIGNICILYTLFKSKRRIFPLSSTVQSSSLPYQRTYSILLVALNIVFITCTLPVAVYFIGEPYWIPKDIPMNIKHQDPWWCLVNMLMYTNSCVNFVLYCISGSKFRAAVKKCALKCGKCFKFGNGQEQGTTQN